MDKYKPPQTVYGYWSEHPDYPSSDWKQDVSNDDTRLGYWEWVELKIAEEEGHR